MKKLLAALFAAALWAAPASPAIYHVRTNGSPFNAGTTYDKPWTMSKANTSALPGDIIRVYPGAYSVAPNPDSAGSNPTGAGRITFIGTANPGVTLDIINDPTVNPEARAASVPGHTASKSYVTLAGLIISGGLTIGSSTNWDSIRACTIQGNLQIDGDYNVISLSDCNGQFFQMGRNALKTAGNIIENTNFPNIGKGVSGNPLSLWVVGNSECPTGVSHLVDSTRFDRLARTITVETTLGDAHPVVFYKVRNTSQNYCNTYIDLKRTNRESYVYRLRDSTQVLTFNCDTIRVVGPGSCVMYMSSNGNNECPGRANSVARAVVDSSLWDFGRAQAGSKISWQESMNDFTMTYSTVIANGPALLAYHLRGRSVIDNNTLVGRGYSTTVPGGVVRFEKAQFPSFGDTALTFTDNIVYSTGSAQASDPYKNYSSDPGTYSSAAFFDKALIDSAGAMDLQVKLLSDRNFYSYYGYASAPGDRSIHTRLSGGGFNLYSAPGDSTAGNPRGRWENRFNKVDSLSVYGSPQFADTSAGSFLPMPVVDIGNYGALDYAAQGRLSVAPGIINFSTGIPDSVIVAITNTGDEAVIFEMNGTKLGLMRQFGITTGELLITVDPATTWEFLVRYDGTAGPLAPFNIDLYTLPAAETGGGGWPYAGVQPPDVRLPILVPDPADVGHLTAGATYHTLRIPVYVK